MIAAIPKKVERRQKGRERVVEDEDVIPGRLAGYRPRFYTVIVVKYSVIIPLSLWSAISGAGNHRIPSLVQWRDSGEPFIPANRGPTNELFAELAKVTCFIRTESWVFTDRARRQRNIYKGRSMLDVAFHFSLSGLVI